MSRNINRNVTLKRFDILLEYLMKNNDSDRDDRITEQMNYMAKMNGCIADKLAEMLEKGNVFTQDRELAEYYRRMSNE